MIDFLFLFDIRLCPCVHGVPAHMLRAQFFISVNSVTTINLCLTAEGDSEVFVCTLDAIPVSRMCQGHSKS